jgi:hypothetical protein
MKWWTQNTFGRKVFLGCMLLVLGIVGFARHMETWIQIGCCVLGVVTLAEAFFARFKRSA